MAKKKSRGIIEIVEWLERYEVSSKGREPKPGEELRAGPLPFVRLKVYGHKQGAGYRRLKSVAGDRAMEVFGYFCKFLEIAGDAGRGRRGLLLNEKDGPATTEDLAFILDAPLEQVENAIRVLSDEKVGWISYPNGSQSNSPPTPPKTIKHNTIEGSGNFREFPGKPGSGGRSKGKKFKKPTTQEVEAYAKSINFTIDGHEYVDFYESKDWMVGKNKMTDWKAAVRTWKRRREGDGKTQPEPLHRDANGKTPRENYLGHK